MPAAGSTRPRLLVVLGGAPAAHTPEDADRLIAADRLPAAVRDDELHATTLTVADVNAVPGLRGRLLRTLPGGPALALLVHARRRDHDAVLTWGEGVAWPVALVLCLRRRRSRPRHLAILMWPFDDSAPSAAKRVVKQRVTPVLARHGIDRFWIPAPLQRQRVIERWRIPPQRIVPVQWPVDTAFWRPLDADVTTERICSVGREMRDFQTLLQALDGLGVPCHIAAGTGWRSAVAGSEDLRARNAGDDALPAGVTVGPMPQHELRELYASSRCLVVPLLPTDSDNGVTTVLEAMSMGRPVIATDTAGKADLLEDGVTCLLVPPQDPDALRAAIARLRDDPGLAARLGAAGRERVLASSGLAQWRDGVLAALTDDA